MYRTAAKRLLAPSLRAATHLRTLNRPGIGNPARFCTSTADQSFSGQTGSNPTQLYNPVDDSSTTSDNDEEALHSSDDGGTPVSKFTEEQARVLEASLPHVHRLGWTEAAMKAGARDIGVSPSIVGSFWKEAAFVEAKKKSQALTTIKDVTPQTRKHWTVMVEVVEKFYPHQVPGNSNVFQRLVLADMEGTRVEAILFGADIQKFKNMLKLHHKYRISNARVTLNQRINRIIPNEYQWIINARTPVEEVHDDADLPFQTPWLNLVPFSNLHKCTSSAAQVDVLAVVIDVLPRKHVETKYGEKVVQELVVLNEENKPTILTMWDHFVKNEVGHIQNLLPKFPIILAMRLKVDSYNGIYLSTLTTSSFSINPNLPEANHLRSWIVENEAMLKKTKIEKKYLLPLENTSAFGMTLEPIKISEVGAQIQNGMVFPVVASLSITNTQQKFWYMCCKHCYYSIYAEYNTHFHCVECNKDSVAVPRCRFHVQLHDSSGSLPARIFGEIAEKVFSVDAVTLMENSPEDAGPDISSLAELSSKGEFLIHLKAKIREVDEQIFRQFTILSISDAME